MSFWQNHSVFFLLGLLVFPRLTMLFFMATPLTVFGWLGWLITPRFLAALIGTIYYWDTNPTLCVLAWIAAVLTMGGEAGGTHRAQS